MQPAFKVQDQFGQLKDIIMNTRKNNRKHKRKLNRLTKRLQFGMYFENFAANPAHVDMLRWCGYKYRYDACVEGADLVTGRGCSCSLMHCGPVPLTSEEVKLILQCT